MSSYLYQNMRDSGLIGPLPTTVGVVCTSENVRDEITNIYVFNTAESASREVTLYMVPNNSGAVGTPAAEHMFFRYRLQPGEGYLVEFRPPGLILESANDSVQGVVTDETSDPVNIVVSGRSVTA